MAEPEAVAAQLEAETGRLGGIRRLAWVLLALSLAVVAVSAYIRLQGAGLGCADWPACYGGVLAAPAEPHTGVARGIHRIVASTALLLGFLLVWRCLRPRPLVPAARAAGLLVLLMLFLAAVGIWSADPRRVAVNFVNILGGLGLVTFSWRVVLATGSGRATVVLPGVKAGMAALTATVLLGALIGARYAAASCGTLPHCHGVWWPAGEGWAALDPFVSVAAAARPGDAGASALHLLHRYCALATFLILGNTAFRALQAEGARPAARALIALLGAELVLGVLTVASGFSLWLAVAHGLVAALLLAAAATLARGGDAADS